MLLSRVLLFGGKKPGGASASKRFAGERRAFLKFLSQSSLNGLPRFFLKKPTLTPESSNASLTGFGVRGKRLGGRNNSFRKGSLLSISITSRARKTELTYKDVVSLGTDSKAVENSSMEGFFPRISSCTLFTASLPSCELQGLDEFLGRGRLRNPCLAQLSRIQLYRLCL